jgi:hypothetical protein
MKKPKGFTILGVLIMIIIVFESLNQTARQRNEAVKGGGWVPVVARGSTGSP